MRHNHGLSPDRDTVVGRELLVRAEDVQGLHGFEAAADARTYLSGELFTRDVTGALSPLLEAAPDVRVHDTI
ncbi:hypothetical protein [Streptomyces naphthomycinicus]|uniref:hypothetical protein n=1 Tax=Streptomyces naphthomycinicus TaxID=2872625 RepID=UPI001CED9A28|nr:hypothetical protein [Streptomyces sp. TML10]